jgi:hypothetical protein
VLTGILSFFIESLVEHIQIVNKIKSCTNLPGINHYEMDFMPIVSFYGLSFSGFAWTIDTETNTWPSKMMKLKKRLKITNFETQMTHINFKIPMLLQTD